MIKKPAVGYYSCLLPSDLGYLMWSVCINSEKGGFTLCLQFVSRMEGLCRGPWRWLCQALLHPSGEVPCRCVGRHNPWGRSLISALGLSGFYITAVRNERTVRFSVFSQKAPKLGWGVSQGEGGSGGGRSPPWAALRWKKKRCQVIWQ